MLFKKTLLTNDIGQDVYLFTLEHLWADVFGIKYKKLVEEDISGCKKIDGIKRLIRDLDAKEVRQVNFRLIQDSHSDELSRLLPTIGFKKTNERIEYKKAAAELPVEEGNPLIWQSAQGLNWTAVDVADFLKNVSQGDPNQEANQDPLLYIQDFIQDPELTAGLDCIHVGFLEGKKAALTVVQINPKTGWSRISYMGVAPEFRGKKLGKWVHQYSFARIKKEGGLLYHGGTDLSNKPMIRLFEAHACKMFCKMEEWVYFVGEDGAV